MSTLFIFNFESFHDHIKSEEVFEQSSVLMSRHIIMEQMRQTANQLLRDDILVCEEAEKSEPRVLLMEGKESKLQMDFRKPLR